MILRVRCPGCGNVEMFNARAAYRGVSCARCGATIQTSKRPEARRRPWTAVVVGVVAILGTVGATWGLVAAFSRPTATPGATGENSPPPQESRDDLERPALRIARRLADSIVESRYRGGLGVRTELDGRPARDPATGEWIIPARIEWTGSLSGRAEVVVKDVSQAYWASGTLLVNGDEVDFIWREVAVSSSLQTLRTLGVLD